ncbi:hypothetical protein [uncultured Devosia sp.]|uniref:hypothetical protein n=1 Tax=uncultured Devosia sp. TaxID=211434 RepID=UPI0035CA1384
MHIGLTRAGLLSIGLLLAAALGACTTAEGTNALTDVGTFEREVMISTARGVGLVPGEAPKQDLTQARAPLVLPRAGNQLPAPTVALTDQLPVDSNTVQIDTAGMSEADLTRLRNARVVDLNSLSGRPMTEAEAKALTTRMAAANIAVSGSAKRPLYLPPEEYFTRVGDADLVCRTANGAIVPLSDPSCPDEVRRALRRQGPSGNGSISNTLNSEFNDLQD